MPSMVISSSALGVLPHSNHLYLHGEPQPGRGQPVKAVSRAAVARSASLDGLAQVRPNQNMQTGPLGRFHSPNPSCRLRLKLHSMPPSSR